MNLSPAWAAKLSQRGFDAVHWANVGDPAATDATIMSWARNESRIVVTHDLDFGALLATTTANGPSVLQLRRGTALTDAALSQLETVLDSYRTILESGALIVVDGVTARVRVLPLRPGA